MIQGTSKHRRRGTRVAFTVLGIMLGSAIFVSVSAEEKATFVGVSLNDKTADADGRLRAYLAKETKTPLEREQSAYERVIERLVSWKPSHGVILARTTPYVQVVSELLGADFEVLATYKSMATGKETYHSYYVVRTGDVPEHATPEDVITLIRGAETPVKFTYHDIFSTSSYFRPALHFRANGVYHMAEPVKSLAAIRVVQAREKSSTSLVRAVARGDADLAAVWTGTMTQFLGEDVSVEHADVAAKVQFVQLPMALPNDLLVCSRSASPAFKTQIREAIRNMSADAIGIGDFATWIDIDEAPDARAALAQLRWLAREQVPPVTVKVEAGSGSAAGLATKVEAARHAVRLSGTELVLFDDDFHMKSDMLWTVEEIHDGAARLTTSFPSIPDTMQEFPISFRDAEDLTRRIVTIIQSQLHRIRYVWRYSRGQPLLIRDTTLPLPVGTTLKVQRIDWLDPQRNSFQDYSPFDARVTASNLFVHELDPDDFPDVAGGDAEIDPMSNVSYRTYQLRTQPSNVWFRVATGALVVLLLLAAIASVLAVRRRPRSPPGPTSSSAP